MTDLNIDLNNTADDDFFGSLKGSKASKLQQLFFDDALPADNKEQSLKYQHPKDVASSSSVTSTTLIAKVVTAYKHGELQGKVGLALIENPGNVYNIIIYKTKENILATLKLLQGIDNLYRQEVYWQFYDETNMCWSLSFDNPSDEVEFVKNLEKKNIKYKKNDESETVSEQNRFSNFEKLVQNDDYESSSSRNETKNSLIRRMAKMGKPLPTLSPSLQTTTEYSDSSDNEFIQTHMPKPSIAPRSNKLTSYVDLNSAKNSVFSINPLESQYMQMLLTEQRTQGSEIRMNMNKLENKIEKVLDKLELYDKNDFKQYTGKDDEILDLEEKLLALKKENRKLKQNLHQNSLEQSIEKEMQEVLFAFKDDLQKFNLDCNQGLNSILFGLCDKIKQHTNVIQNIEEKIKNSEKELEKTTLELELKITENSELKNEIIVLKQKESELKNQLKEKETEAFKQHNEIIELQKKLQEKDQKSLGNPNDAVIKSIMNNLFVDMSDKLNSAMFPNSEQILSLIASSIKQQTLQTLQQSIKYDQ